LPGFLDNKDEEERGFTRMDFLQFHTEAVNSVGNRAMKDTISRCAANETNESLAFIVPLIRRAEKPASWVHFPPLSEHDDDSSPIGHTRKTLLVWLFHQFALPVCTTKNKKADSVKYESDGIQKVDVRSVLEDMTIDDMTFIFVQVQHNIAKWNLMYCAYKQKSIDAWKNKESIQECEFDKKMTATDVQRIGDINKYGYEYPTGSGVAGNDGKRRYQAMFKYFYRHCMSRLASYTDGEKLLGSIHHRYLAKRHAIKSQLCRKLHISIH